VITTSGGQHGQESEEGEEGEERSEEDCQEDEEGFQKEEVTRLEENAGASEPATSPGLSAGFTSRSDFLIGGSSRRKRVSARHQVKRLDRSFNGFAHCKSIRQKKQVFFLRADTSFRGFTGGFRFREI
jgi:hypothetical protein